MKKAKRRRAVSSSGSSLTAPEACRETTCASVNAKLKRRGGSLDASHEPTDGAAGLTAQTKPVSDAAVARIDGRSVSSTTRTVHGNTDSSGSPHSSATYGTGGAAVSSRQSPVRCGGSPPLQQQRTALAGWEDLDQTSRHSLNWEEFFGSSLDLAPSLLNIYDNIIASTSKSNGGENDTEDDSEEPILDAKSNDDTDATARFSSPDISGATSTTSTSPKQEAAGHHRSSTSGVQLRSASAGKHQLPSLSVPPDRPVSMAEAEGLASASGNHGARGSSDRVAQDKKQRPLSMSSGSMSPSSPPNSSLARRARRKQALLRGRTGGHDFDEDMIPEDSSDEVSEQGRPSIRRCDGNCSKAKENLATKNIPLTSTTQLALVSESRNSVDSGCVLQGDGSLNQIRNTGVKSVERIGKHGDTNDEEEGCESSKTCSCYLYDNMSISSSDTAGSGSFSYRDEVDSSMSSIREGSASQLAPVSSSSSSSSSLTPDKNIGKDDKDSLVARRSITGLPISTSEGFLSSSSTRRHPLHSPSNLPLGHHYQNYQPLDERLATSPDAGSKVSGYFSLANDSGLVGDSYFSSTPGSRLSESLSSSSRTNASMNSSGVSDSYSALSGLQDPPSPSGNRNVDSSARRSSSFSKTEARKRFFSNYEEHMRQTEEQQNQRSQSPALDESERALHQRNHPATPNLDHGMSVTEHLQSENDSRLKHSTTGNSDVKSNEQRRKQQHPKLITPIETAISTSPEPVLLRSSAKSSKSSVSKKDDKYPSHSPPTSPKGHSSSSASHRISASVLSSKTSKKRESASSTGDGKGSSASSGYVSYVQRVVAEILDSERTYISSLEDIIQGYQEPMEKILSSTDAREDLACLFGNIKEIYKFGHEFLADLEKTSLDPVKVAECFVKHNKGFVIYTDYCTNYPRAVEVLTRFMQHPELSELCKERQLALGHGLPLGAYLLRPVQRILKYHLLLQNIVKNCEKESGSSGRAERSSTSSTASTGSGTRSGSGSGSSSILEQAFQHMTQMASHINEMKRKHEHAVRIQEIQSQLEDYVGEDLTRLGDLVLESTFRVYGAKASRQVFLFERGLLISKKKEGGMLSCKTFIRCSNLMLVEVIPNEPLSFHTIPFDNPRAQYTLQARNMEQKRRWCQEIKRLILESYKEKIPDNVKSLVMQLGRNHDDDYVTKEALEAVRKNQHTAPEYLEKRRFRRKSGPRLPDFSLLKPQRAKRGANNKKGENKGTENTKLSPDISRRAESKSPESHRKFLIRQNAKKRSQSQTASLPTTPISDPTYSELFTESDMRKQSNGAGSQTVSQTSTPKKSEVGKASEPKRNHFPTEPSASNDSSPSSSLSAHVAAALVSSPNVFSSPLCSNSSYQSSPGAMTDQDTIEAEENEEDTAADLMESLITKRASSFRKAMRAHPITSADITELMVRCGGGESIRMPSKPGSPTKASKLQETNKEQEGGYTSDKDGEPAIENIPSNSMKDLLNASLASRSDYEDFDDDDDEISADAGGQFRNDDIQSQIKEASRAISNGNFISESEHSLNGTSTEMYRNSRSASLPLLNDSDDDEESADTNKSVAQSANANKEAGNFKGQKCVHTSKKHQQRQKSSHSVEDICDRHEDSKVKTSTGRGRMSRRDLQDAAAEMKRKSHKLIETKNDDLIENFDTKQGNGAKTCDKNNSEIKCKPESEFNSDNTVLLRNKKKSLRLPNTHKHLSVQDYTSISALEDKSFANGSRAKLIGWSSAEKLTKGSMTDVSHLSEDPWVRNTDIIPTGGNKNSCDGRQRFESNDFKILNSHTTNTPVSSSNGIDQDSVNQLNLNDLARWRDGLGYGGSKDNLDWLVYLNRNSDSLMSPLGTSSKISKSHSPVTASSVSLSQTANTANTNSTSSLSQHKDALPNLSSNIQKDPSSRAFTNSKNVHKLETFRKYSLGNNEACREPSTSLTSETVPLPITQVPRSARIHESSNLSRSNSLPTTHGFRNCLPSGAAKSFSTHRPASIQNFDHLSAQESAQMMVAEMEEYIKEVTSSRHGERHHRSMPKRFPTCLPAITVEEEAEGDRDDDDDDDDTRPSGSNRLSVISSLSTSSYESQGSWSSGGSDELMGSLVGTLKHKLHTWAKDADMAERRDTELKNSSSDGSTINRESALVSDNESDDEYVELATEQSHTDHSKAESVKHDSDKETYCALTLTTKSLANNDREILNEERLLESVLRQHSLGSSSLGLRMANTIPLPDNSIPVPILDASTEESPENVSKPSDTLSTSKCTNATKSESNLSNTGNVQTYESIPPRKTILSNVDNESKSSYHALTSPVSSRVSTSVRDVSRTTNEIANDHASILNRHSPAELSVDPLQARYSLPPTKEATEALVPPALRGESYEIQQSDSGFSLQSASSSSNDSSSNVDSDHTSNPSPILEDVLLTASLEKSDSVFKPLQKCPANLHDGTKFSPTERKDGIALSSSLICDNFEQKHDPTAKTFNEKQEIGMKRCESCESIDSTDSFYERRLSVAFESDAFKNFPMKAKNQPAQCNQTLPLLGTSSLASLTTTTMVSSATNQQAPLVIDHADNETPLSRKSIREYVQSIEEMFKPQSPKVLEVRRREPGEMIRQRLQTLKDQTVHGRQDGNEERGHGYARSKSQPPSHHRSMLHPNPSLPSPVSGSSGEESSHPKGHQHRCLDDIVVHDLRLSGQSLPKHKDTQVWGSKESVFAPSCRDFISRSRERLSSSRDKLYSSQDNLKLKKRSASTDLIGAETKVFPLNKTSVMSSPVFAKKDLNFKNLHYSPHYQHLGHDRLHNAASNIPAYPDALDNSIINSMRNSSYDLNARPRHLLTSSSTLHNDSVDHQWHRMNQFVHRARSSSEQSAQSPSERSPSPAFSSGDTGTKGIKVSSSFCSPSPLERHPQQQHLSRSMCRLDQLSTEVDNLVIMKGWVRSLISKFQDQP